MVGTSLKVYPAASLLQYVRAGVPVYLVDPGTPDIAGVGEPFTFIKKRAAEGVPELVNRLIKELS